MTERPAPNPNCWTCDGTGIIRGTKDTCPSSVPIPAKTNHDDDREKDEDG